MQRTPRRGYHPSGDGAVDAAGEQGDGPRRCEPTGSPPAPGGRGRVDIGRVVAHLKVDGQLRMPDVHRASPGRPRQAGRRRTGRAVCWSCGSSCRSAWSPTLKLAAASISSRRYSMASLAMASSSFSQAAARESATTPKVLESASKAASMSAVVALGLDIDRGLHADRRGTRPWA